MTTEDGAHLSLARARFIRSVPVLALMLFIGVRGALAAEATKHFNLAAQDLTAALLEFENESLSAVIEELTRYTDQPILLGSDRLKTQRIIGTLQVRDIREALHDLEDISPIVVRQDGAAFVLDLRESNPRPGR